MLKNYIKIAFRQLWRHKFYSLINISGLAIGLASCLLIFLYVQDELSYDQFHKNKDRIYRITEEFKTGDGVMSTALTPYRIGPEIRRQFPQVEKMVRIDYDIEPHVVKVGDKKFSEQRITSTDPEFFSLFSFPLLEGNARTALVEPYTVAISNEMAEKYFPGERALGKTMEFINAQNYKSFQVKVTGVYKAMPSNSHFHKDFLLSTATADILIPERREELGWTSHFTYFLFRPGTDPAKMQKAINDYITKSLLPEQARQWISRFRLQSLNDIHLRSNEKEELEANGDINYVYIFSAIALFVLVLACINYMNLATARAANRAREVGVRKVVGAVKKQLVFQFLSESVLITLMAMVLALMLAMLTLPFFNQVSGKTLSLSFIKPQLLVIMFSSTIAAGLFAGSYPAFFLSAYQPVKVLKGTLAKAGSGALLLRRSLVVLQFSISIILIIGTIVIYTQWNYLQNKKTGLSTEQTLVIPLASQVLQKNYYVLKNSLLASGAITNVTAARKDPTSRFGNYTGVTVQGRDGFKVVPWLGVDSNFFRSFEIPVVAGRDFRARVRGDTLNEYLINEAAVQLLELKDPVGTHVTVFDNPGRIVGVVKDFHFESLHSKLSPILFSTGDGGLNSMTVRIKAGNTANTLAFIEKEYKKADPESTFTYTFLDEKIAGLYVSEARFFSVFTSFSGLAIFIACLGIFGLASFTASQRNKEIGIRKVLGASVQSISILLTKEFIWLVIVANIIAWPTAWFMMKKWLEDFPYRIEQGTWMFLLAAVLAILIAVITVSSQAIKAALCNPVKSLKAE
jgi:putative ABC transport system permease protein